MDPIELGMDRMVVSTWAPDDSWPASVEGYGEDERADGLKEIARQAGARPVGGGGAAADDDSDVARTDLDVPPHLVDTVAPIPADPLIPPGSEAVEALAAVDGHPLHPVVVPLPIGAFLGAFVADVAYLRTGDRFWARGARVLTIAGLVTGLLAGSLGAIDFTGRRRIRRHPSAWVHAGGNATVLTLAVASIALRGRDERDAVANGGLAISAASAAILGVTGWLGGELAYRQRIGVTAR